MPAKPDPQHEYYESQPSPDQPIALPNATGAASAPQTLSESVFETQQQAFQSAMQKAIADMPKWKQQMQQTLLGGHGELGPVPSFASWYSTLQNWLCSQAEWGEMQENLQRLLYHYARWKITAAGTKPIWPAVEYMCRFIGRSEGSYNANKAYKTPDGKTTPNTGEMVGYPGGGWWCAPASTRPVTALLARWSLQMGPDRDPQGSWGRACGSTVQNNTSTDKEKNIDLCSVDPGDILIMLGPKTPPSGHVGTVVSADPFDKNNAAGSKIIYISGNAGAKSVRIDEVTRLPTPPGYNYSKIASAFNKAHELDGQEKAIGSLERQHHRKYDDPEDNKEMQAEHADIQGQKDDAQQNYDSTAAGMGGQVAPTKDGTRWIVTVMKLSRMELPPFASQSQTFKDLDEAGLDAYMKKFALEFTTFDLEQKRKLRAVDQAAKDKAAADSAKSQQQAYGS